MKLRPVTRSVTELLLELAFQLFCRGDILQRFSLVFRVNMSLQLFNTPLAAAWQSSRNKIFKMLGPIWKLQKVTFSSVVPNLQNLSIQSSLLQKSTILFPRYFFWAIFWKRIQFFFQFDEIFGTCFRPTCTKSWSPLSKRLMHVCHATISTDFCIFASVRISWNTFFRHVPYWMPPIWQSPIFLFGLDHMWSYMNSTTLLFKSKLVQNCLSDTIAMHIAYCVLLK